MPVHLIRKVRDRQPTRQARIDWSHPLFVQGIPAALFAVNNGVDIVGRAETLSNTLRNRPVSDRSGKGIVLPNDTSTEDRLTYLFSASGYKSTFIWVVTSDGPPGNSYGMFTQGYGNSDYLQTVSADGGANFHFYANSGMAQAFPVTIGKPTCIVISRDIFNDKLTDHIWAQDGKKGAGPTAYATDTSVDTYRSIGNNYSLPRGGRGKIHAFIHLPYLITQKQALDISANPWQIFEPETIPLFYSTGSVTNYALTASGGSYSVTGTQADVKRSKYLVSSAGTYSVTGGSATVSRNRKLISSGGTYTYTGQTISITYAGIIAAYNLIAQGGSYAVAGSNTTILKNKLLSAVGGLYSNTGASAQVSKSKYIVAGSGAYTITASSAGILKSKLLVSSGGTYTNTGSSATLKKSKYLFTSGGTYSFVGSSVVLIHGGLGGIVWPPVYQVLLGTTYGPTGSEYTGTLDAYGIKYDIKTGVLVKPLTDKVVISL